MEDNLFAIYDRWDDTYWRQVALRNLLLEFFARYQNRGDGCRVLEIGCGVGATLRRFSQVCETHGVELSRAALRYARTRVSKNLVQGSGVNLPYQGGSFDMVMSTDVVEHIASPGCVFEEVYRVLRPGGLWMVIVPAYRWLWSDRDIRLQHQKRYRRRELRSLFAEHGFEVLKATYINLFYLPIFAAAVFTSRLANQGRAVLGFDFLIVPRSLNELLRRLLEAETALLKRLNFPTGSAVFCVGRRPAGAALTARPGSVVPSGHGDLSRYCLDSRDSTVAEAARAGRGDHQPLHPVQGGLPRSEDGGAGAGGADRAAAAKRGGHH
jgi:SAM-dependent methyltransferase